MRVSTRCTILAFAIAVAAIGCGGNQKKLVGTWVIDTEATMQTLTDSPSFANMPEAQKNMMMPMLEKSLGPMSVTFTKKTMSMSVPQAGSGEEVAYTVKSSKGDTIVIGSEDQQNDLRIEFTGADTMKFSPTTAGAGGPMGNLMFHWKRKK